LGKIITVVATRGKILRLKCTKIVFRLGVGTESEGKKGRGRHRRGRKDM